MVEKLVGESLGLPFPGDVGDTLPNRRGKLFDGDIGGVKGGDDGTAKVTGTVNKDTIGGCA